MSLCNVAAGREVPNDINVVIEIPMHGDPIKYEVDKDTGAVFVDRFMATSMRYPLNYGYIPATLGGDGDPLDVLVLAPFPLIPGSVVRCRPVGLLDMEDEAGEDFKLVAVPVAKLTPIYNHINTPDDLPTLLREQVEHFFNHYKDLEKGKWVKIKGWRNVEDARTIIMDGVKAGAEGATCAKA